MNADLWPDVNVHPVRAVPPEHAYQPRSQRGNRGPDRKPRRRPGETAEERDQRVNFGIVRATVRDEDKIREKVPDQLGDLLHKYFGFDWQPFHLELLRLMFKGGKWVVNLPTDHGKSTVCNYLFPILSLMHNPDEAHIVCCANEDDSKSWVQMIQRHLEGDGPEAAQLIKDYPWVQKPPLDVAQSWSTRQLTVAGRSVNKRNPSVLAIGAGSKDIKGRRGKLIIDDVEGPEHEFSPTEREKLLRWVKRAALRCYEDRRESTRPLILACGTPWDPDSIYFRLEGGVWQSFRFKIYTDPEPWASTNPWDHVPPHASENFMLWPEKFAKVREQWGDMSADEFAIAYLMDPKRGDPSRLTLEEIEALTRAAGEPGEKALTFVSLDPAGDSRTKGSDYAGIAVVEIRWPEPEELPFVKVREAFAFRQGLFEQVHAAADLCRKYDARLIYETEGLGASYRNAFEHIAPDVAQTMIPSHTRNYRFETSMGITVVRTLVQKQRLLIPESKFDDRGMKAFRGEIRDLGGSAHDHISAAVWFVVRHIYNQVRLYSGPKLISGFGPGVKTGFQRMPNWRSYVGGRR